MSRALAGLLAVAVASCSRAPPAREPAAAAPASAPALAAPAEGEEEKEALTSNEAGAPVRPLLAFITDDNEPGARTHLASGYHFPGHYQKCVRAGERIYDDKTLDVSVSYHCSTGDLTITMYVYPSEELDLERHFAEVMYAIEHQHPGAELEGGTRVTSPFGDIARPGLMSHVKWTEEGTGTRRSSMTLLFDDGNGWFLKVRSSFDASSKQGAEIAHSLYGAALKGLIFTRREIDWDAFTNPD